MDIKRFKSNWYYFWGHTCWHITDFGFWSWFMDDKDSDMEIKLPYIIWSWFFNKYQYYIGKKVREYDLYEWQKKYYG
jgi:hypothetical protein